MLARRAVSSSQKPLHDTNKQIYLSQVCVHLLVQAKAASDARLARDIQEAEDRAEANAAEEARLRQEEWDSIDRSAHSHSSITNHSVSWKGHMGLTLSFIAPAVPTHRQSCMTCLHTKTHNAQAVHGQHL